MSYKIVVDSCGELKPEQKSDIHFASASLELDVDDYHVVDDESFDQKEFLRRVKRVRTARSLPARPRSAI